MLDTFLKSQLKYDSIEKILQKDLKIIIIIIMRFSKNSKSIGLD
ncbi:hypothetical protein BGP_2873 [Beggiatoa sp. PS]|nr:hypothetical protein BGP_2873 [Beggiatoa sp. PS]